MYFEKHTAHIFNQINSFLRDSWFEIPDRTSPSRIMRPQFIKRTQNGQLRTSSDRDQHKSNGYQASKHVQGEKKENAAKTDEGESDEKNNGSKKETREGKQTEYSKQDDFINASALYVRPQFSYVLDPRYMDL
jgi:DNA mismatch repair ATPase MutL